MMIRLGVLLVAVGSFTLWYVSGGDTDAPAVIQSGAGQTSGATAHPTLPGSLPAATGEQQPSPAKPVSRAATGLSRPVFGSAEAYELASVYGRLPDYMRDVQLEHLQVSADGSLIVDETIKRVIEYFLLASQAEGREQAIERLFEFIELTLPELAASEALSIASRYLEYRDNLAIQEFPVSSDLSDPTVLKQIRESLEARRALRREYLGEPVSEALFGYEERYESYSLTRVEVNTNDQLTPSEKELALTRAEKALPPELASRVRYNREEKKLQQKVGELQAEGGNEAEIYGLRKDFYGEAAADRMAFLEDNSASWQSRVSQFYQVQQDILQGPGDQQEKYSRISELKQQLFSSKEQIKLAVQSIRGQAG